MTDFTKKDAFNDAETEETEEEETELEDVVEQKEGNDVVPVDFFQLFLKPVSEMSDTELDSTYEKLRAMRKVRIGVTRKKDMLDQVLGQLSMGQAQQILEKLKKKKETEEESNNAEPKN
jgi:hypothetical protein